MTAVETATVIPIRRDNTEPRHLAHRKHQVEPPASQPLAHLQWVIEQRLEQLADRDESPYDALVLLDADVQQRAASALDALFDAAQAVADRANSGQGAGPVYVYEDAYGDCLHTLAQIVRGAA